MNQNPSNANSKSNLWESLDAMLCIQLSLSLHGEPDAVRKTLARLAEKPYCPEDLGIVERLNLLGAVPDVVEKSKLVTDHYYLGLISDEEHMEEVVDSDGELAHL